MASVLIVDDHEGTRDTYSTLLRHAGFETRAAATGGEGIDAALAHPFDVLLVDLRLPDMLGIEIIRQLKLCGVTARMVVVTAFPGVDTSFDAAAAGADGYVDSPLFGDEVVEVVQQAVDGRVPVRHPSAGQGTQRPRGTPVSHIDPRVREVLRLIEADLEKPLSLTDR